MSSSSTCCSSFSSSCSSSSWSWLCISSSADMDSSSTGTMLTVAVIFSLVPKSRTKRTSFEPFFSSSCSERGGGG